MGFSPGSVLYGGRRGRPRLVLAEQTCSLKHSPDGGTAARGPMAVACSPHYVPMPKYRKVVMLGYPSVGKSSLAIQFTEGRFHADYDPTIQNNFNKTITVGGDEFQITVVDTAGHDEVSVLSPSFVLGIHGYIVVYSVTSQKSFIIAKAIFSKLQDRRGKSLMPIVLVGNKTDLPANTREVETEEGKKLAEVWGAAFMEVSAKDTERSKVLFTKIIEEIDRVERSFSDVPESKCTLM